MKTTITAIALLLCGALAHASDIPAGAQQPVGIGDSWTFKRVATGESTVASRIIFKISQQGPDNQYVYQSLNGEVNGMGSKPWRNASRIDKDTCMIDFFGGGMLGITHSCSTAFVPGMDWNTEVIDKGTRTIQRFQIIGPEEVTVGAGTFNAIKIESHWEVAKVLKQGKAPLKFAAPLRYRFVYWYAPEAKTMVRSEREFRNSAGAIDTRSTEELQAFRVQKL